MARASLARSSQTPRRRPNPRLPATPRVAVSGLRPPIGKPRALSLPDDSRTRGAVARPRGVGDERPEWAGLLVGKGSSHMRNRVGKVVPSEAEIAKQVAAIDVLRANYS